MGNRGNKGVENKFRKTGIEAIGDVRWGTHLCQFYHAKEDLIDILVPYFKAGLENNEFCVWVTSELLSEEEAEKALMEALPNFGEYLKKGQIEIIPHTKWYHKDGVFNLKGILNAWIDKLDQALSAGYDGVRATGNTAWLEKRDWKNFTDYEEEVNNAISKYQMIVICTYSLNKCGASEILDVAKNHQFALIKQHGKWGVITSSERKKAEEELRESEQRLKKTFDLSPIGIIIATIDGKIEYANNAACDMTCYKKEEAIGMPTKELFVDPTERDKSIEIIKKEGQRLNYIFHYKKKNGKTGIALTNSRLIDLGKGLRLVVNLNDVTEFKKLEKDQKILSEKITRLTKKIPLTDNEKLVFYGLVKYPLLNDQQLSEKLKIKRSTITAIKNKLLRQGFYSTYVIPNFELIGCELMCIINSKHQVGGGGAMEIIKKIVSSPEFIYSIKTDKDFLSIIVSKNFVEAKKLIDYVSSLYEGSDIEPPNTIYFPFAMSSIVNLFDYSGLLKSLFNLNVKEEIDKPIKSTKRKLTDNEKIILYALTEYPILTNREISIKTKVSIPTVTKIKKNLLKENFLKIVNIPDAKKLNCELLVYSNAKIDLKKINEQNQEMQSLIFRVDSERESNGIFVFENYTQYKMVYDKFKEGQFAVQEPICYLFPIQQIKYQKMDFAPFVKKIFELKVDF